MEFFASYAWLALRALTPADRPEALRYAIGAMRRRLPHCDAHARRLLQRWIASYEEEFLAIV